MNPDQLREAIEYLDACLRELHQDADGNLRDLSPDEQTRFDEGLALRQRYAADLARHEEIARLTPVTGVPGDRPQPFNAGPGIDPVRVADDYRSTPVQLRDAALKVIEERLDDKADAAYAAKVLKRHLNPDSKRETKEWARGLILRASDVYQRAWAKYVTGQEMLLTDEERTALQVGSNTSGGYLLPTHLDPSIILTNAGTSNVIRGISRQVTLTEGTIWNGVTSAGMTLSWDGELAEVSDDSPAFGRVSIATNIAQGFAQASIAAFEDLANLQSDVAMMFADGKDRLEGAAHATGLGSSNQPKGVFTAVHAVTARRVQSTTAATIGEVDLRAVYNAIGVRWRSRSQWLLNPLYSTAIKALGTAVSAQFSGDLRDPTAGRIMGRDVVESDDAPTTQTTTALDDEVLLGDFSNYVIVDKPGSMAIEFIPHLFNAANNLPDGRRGWFAYWRTGADVVNTSAFALLVDKTSA